MSEYLINSSTLTGIADAIRSKTGSSSAFTPSQMISEIENIPPKKSAIMPRTYYQTPIENYTDSEYYILDSAFYRCTNLTTVSFSNCLVIEQNAFAICRSLSDIYFPNCSYIGWYAFQGCVSLSTVSFPNCSLIDGEAFVGTSVTTAYFPKCMKISYNAFSGARLQQLYLNEVSSVTILANSTALPSRIGRIYVPSSLYYAFLSDSDWQYFVGKITSV